MAENLDEKISYYESPTYAVAKALREKGYEIANHRGVKIVGEPLHDVLGILEPRDPIVKNFFGLRWLSKQRALYLGTLWVDNNAYGAKPDERWVLEVYGRSSVQKLTELMREIPKPREVSILIRLKSERGREEVYESDYDVLWDLDTFR